MLAYIWIRIKYNCRDVAESPIFEYLSLKRIKETNRSAKVADDNAPDVFTYSSSAASTRSNSHFLVNKKTKKFKPLTICLERVDENSRILPNISCKSPVLSYKKDLYSHESLSPRSLSVALKKLENIRSSVNNDTTDHKAGLTRSLSVSLSKMDLPTSQVQQVRPVRCASLSPRALSVALERTRVYYQNARSTDGIFMLFVS